MFDSFVLRIRQRSREQYQDGVRNAITDLRIWIQEHPEPAFLVALVGGIGFVLLFKMILFLAGLAAVVGFVIYAIALPEGAGTATAASSTASESAVAPSSPSGETGTRDPYGPHGVQ